MQAFVKLTGIVAPLEALNVVPKQFLKRIGRTEFDDALETFFRTQG